MKEELKNIIKELKEVLKEEQIKISDFELMDFCLRVYLTNEINKNKKVTIEETGKVFFGKKKEESKLRNELEPTETDNLATPNQLAFLRKQKKEIPEGLTKREAYLLIKGIKGR